MLRNLNAFTLLLCVCINSVGCGGGGGDAPKTVPATGTITVDGRPMGKLSVAFMPTQGKVATGETDSEGRFTLMTNTPGDGAVVGTYSVSVAPILEVQEAMPGMDGYKKPGPPPFAKKFTDHKKSGLTATVDADPAKNDFKFELTSK
ncbi:hypothetical protein Pan44_34630 [Caulifigura coniformis]|uniref:Carboxypeptidase regulatory-like domain-containing protein n=2 Tax=Caulifigura coniformis TaxID=2527983 RepID=A0A517SH26_9PLAN|nr:hypothetical protein Pan44_34630 [Caulifigura coniformis]